jgi:hypothetical protein
MVVLAEHNDMCWPVGDGFARVILLGPRTQVCHSHVVHVRGCLFPTFRHFFISFRKIKKLDGPKNEKLEVPFHELISFSLLGPSSFWISRKLI